MLPSTIDSRPTAKGEFRLAVKAISEFTIQPGRRDEFVRLFDSLVAQHSESMRVAGCNSATVYVVVGDTNKAVEISEWESAGAREKMMSSEAMVAFAPLFELLATPPSATVIERLL
jgi:quinol monooxygenase YgiN